MAARLVVECPLVNRPHRLAERVASKQAMNVPIATQVLKLQSDGRRCFSLESLHPRPCPSRASPGPFRTGSLPKLHGRLPAAGSPSEPHPVNKRVTAVVRACAAPASSRVVRSGKFWLSIGSDDSSSSTSSPRSKPIDCNLWEFTSGSRMN